MTCPCWHAHDPQFPCDLCGRKHCFASTGMNSPPSCSSGSSRQNGGSCAWKSPSRKLYWLHACLQCGMSGGEGRGGEGGGGGGIGGDGDGTDHGGGGGGGRGILHVTKSWSQTKRPQLPCSFVRIEHFLTVWVAWSISVQKGGLAWWNVAASGNLEAVHCSQRGAIRSLSRGV